MENKNKVDLFQTLLPKLFLKKQKRRINADNENYMYKTHGMLAKNPEVQEGFKFTV